MRYLMTAALPLAILAGPALAEPSCAPQAAVKPMWRIAKTFEDAGGTIQQMKTTNGCYEIYGHRNDRRAEVFFDPNTGHEIE